MSSASLPDSRFPYWSVHETACWFAGESPDYEQPEKQLLGQSANSELGKLYRLLKDGILDRTLAVAIPIGDLRNWRLIPRVAIKWAQSRGIDLRPELIAVSAMAPGAVDDAHGRGLTVPKLVSEGVPPSEDVKQNAIEWTAERRQQLREEHARLKVKSKSPTKDLAKKYNVSATRIRELKAEPKRKRNTWGGLGE